MIVFYFFAFCFHNNKHLRIFFFFNFPFIFEIREFIKQLILSEHLFNVHIYIYGHNVGFGCFVMIAFVYFDFISIEILFNFFFFWMSMIIRSMCDWIRSLWLFVFDFNSIELLAKCVCSMNWKWNCFFFGGKHWMCNEPIKTWSNLMR